MSNLEAPETKTVAEVEIFAVGEWTDSQGHTRPFTQADIDTIIANFDSTADPIPLKVGHTSDDFNTKVADEMGVPRTALTGEDGAGAARLGVISALTRDEDKLIATFENVPEPLTDMIESGMFNAVSVELDVPEDDVLILSGVAILGAELPAVPTLASLDQSTVYSHMKASKTPWVTLTFQEDGEAEQIDPQILAEDFKAVDNGMEELIRGKKGARTLRAFWAEVRAKMSKLTGIQFSSFSNWQTIIDQSRDTTMSIPLDFVAKVCPEIASQMGMNGQTSLKVKGFELPPALKSALIAHGGDPDDQFFGRLMSMDMGVRGGDKLGLCALLTREHTGAWPNMEDNQMAENNTPNPNPDNPMPQREMEEDIMPNFQLDPAVDLPVLYEFLGLPDTATIEDVLAAIEARGAGEEMPPEEEMPMPEAPIPGMQSPEMAELQKRMEALESRNQHLEHNELVTSYQKYTTSWHAVAGNPEELAKELTTIHENAGKDAAEKMVLVYQQANQAAEEAGVLKAVGTSINRLDTEVKDDFQDEVEAYAKTEGITFNKALGVMASQKPTEFAEYHARVNAAMNPSEVK